MGWKTGQGLGLNNDGTTCHIKISVKDDNLGIGASRKDSEGGWLNNSKSYQEVLDKLAASASTNSTVIENGNEAKIESVDKKRKLISDKQKQKKKKKSKKSKSKDKKEKNKKEIIQTNPTVLKQAHRAKFIRNKAVSTYSEENLKEILGDINF